MIRSEIKIRVLYAHTDKMGIVYYGRYYEYFEAGRNEFLRRLGYPYSRIESGSYMLPVIESHCKYYASAKYDDEVILHTILKEIPGVRIRLEYELFSHENLKLAEGHTVHSFVNSETMKPSRPPGDFIELIKNKFNEY